LKTDTHNKRINNELLMWHNSSQTVKPHYTDQIICAKPVLCKLFNHV